MHLLLMKLMFFRKFRSYLFRVLFLPYSSSMILKRKECVGISSEKYSVRISGSKKAYFLFLYILCDYTASVSAREIINGFRGESCDRN